MMQGELTCIKCGTVLPDLLGCPKCKTGICAKSELCTLIKVQTQTEGRYEFSNPAIAKVKRRGNKLVFTVEYASENVAKAIDTLIQKYEKTELLEHPAKINGSPYLANHKLKEAAGL